MFLMVTGFMNYGQQTVRVARYIGQTFMITLSHTNHLRVTIQYPYEKNNHIRTFSRSNPF